MKVKPDVHIVYSRRESYLAAVERVSNCWIGERNDYTYVPVNDIGAYVVGLAGSNLCAKLAD